MSSASRQAWRELLRAANVFTAISNAAAGHFVAYGPTPAWNALALLVLASGLLYEAGMALNDAFDAGVDARERPERPIPSGRITRRAAFTAGWALLAAGIVVAGVAAWTVHSLAPLGVAVLLALAIVLYDGGLKQTWAGPLAMGWCRFLNVALGASSAPHVGQQQGVWIVATAIGLYTVGLTLIARSEVALEGRRGLRIGGALTVAAIAMIAAWGVGGAQGGGEPMWIAGLAASLWVATGSPPGSLVRLRSPAEVRRHVGRLILGFVVLDAWTAGMRAGWPAALAIAAFIIPARLMARRAPMT